MRKRKIQKCINKCLNHNWWSSGVVGVFLFSFLLHIWGAWYLWDLSDMWMFVFSHKSLICRVNSGVFIYIKLFIFLNTFPITHYFDCFLHWTNTYHSLFAKCFWLQLWIYLDVSLLVCSRQQQVSWTKTCCYMSRWICLNFFPFSVLDSLFSSSVNIELE